MQQDKSKPSSKILKFNKDHGIIKTKRQAQHTIRDVKGQVWIDIDCAEFTITWRMTKRQAAELVKSLRLAFTLGEESKLDQTFTIKQPRIRRGK